MMIGHHCHSWLDGGGWIGGVNVGVASVGAGSILGVGCCLMIGGGWTKTPNMFCWAYCRFYNNIWERLMN